MDDNTEREQGTDRESNNWIDLGAEDEGRHLRETQERTRATIQSAIERGVIPDIWKLPLAELNAFQYGLRQMMIAQIRNSALRPLGEAGDYTDAELREAWRYVDNLRQQTAAHQYNQLMQQGLVPDPAKVDPELYSYYIKAAMDRITLPAKQEEFVKVWADVQAEWREQHAAESVPPDGPVTPANVTAEPNWRVGGKPINPAGLTKLVEDKAIDPQTKEGAAAILDWAKEYQEVNGRFSLNVTRDIDRWVGVPYKTLYSRAQNKQRKRRTNSE